MRKILLIIGVLLAAAAIWYFFIKSYDYRVSFTLKANTGTVNQTIKTWLKTQNGGKELEKDSILHFSHLLTFNDSIHRYDWELSSIHDSLTQVKVYASDTEHSFDNKLKIPFSDTDFEKRTRKTLLSFSDNLKEHLQNIRVRIVGEDELQTTYCAYVTAKVAQIGKARAMMRDLPLLSNLLAENKVQLNGAPFIEITEWDQEKDSITFDFCYPIVRSQFLPQHPELKYKRFYGKSAVKAEYNGNYITSDRAWYALWDYAVSNDIPVTGLPVEVFYNNPNMGGDALQWKAEIFMPIKEEL